MIVNFLSGSEVFWVVGLLLLSYEHLKSSFPKIGHKNFGFLDHLTYSLALH